jgi:hypothetical protein
MRLAHRISASGVSSGALQCQGTGTERSSQASAAEGKESGKGIRIECKALGRTPCTGSGVKAGLSLKNEVKGQVI